MIKPCQRNKCCSWRLLRTIYQRMIWSGAEAILENHGDLVRVQCKVEDTKTATDLILCPTQTLVPNSNSSTLGWTN